jgi:hypothetical protein
MLIQVFVTPNAIEAGVVKVIEYCLKSGTMRDGWLAELTRDFWEILAQHFKIPKTRIYHQRNRSKRQDRPSELRASGRFDLAS